MFLEKSKSLEESLDRMLVEPEVMNARAAAVNDSPRSATDKPVMHRIHCLESLFFSFSIFLFLFQGFYVSLLLEALGR